MATHMDPLKSAAFPYEATLPGSATFYVLLRRPDLRHTPIGRQINTLAGGNADFADGAIEDVVDDQRIAVWKSNTGVGRPDQTFEIL